MFIARRRPTGLLSATTARRAAVSSTVGSSKLQKPRGTAWRWAPRGGVPGAGLTGWGGAPEPPPSSSLFSLETPPLPSRLLCNAPPQNPLQRLQFSGPPHSSRQKSLLYWSGDADSWGTLRPLDSFSISQHYRPEG